MLFIFLDGVGVGPDDPASNPFAGTAFPNLEAIAGRRLVLTVNEQEQGPQRGLPIPGNPGRTGLVPLDATLGMPGLPQSATGQTALLTGINAAEAIGQHLGPYPNAALRQILADFSVWRRLTESGRRVAYANAFPDRYLDRAATGQLRMGAMARSAMLAGVRLRGPSDLMAGSALSAFVTNEGWQSRLGYDVPPVDEVGAAAHLARLALDHDFTLFECYATDVAGHSASMEAARATLAMLDRFFGGLRAYWPKDRPLIVVSDHGNIEDISHSRHTTNPALGIWSGPRPSSRLASLTDVAEAVLAAV